MQAPCLRLLVVVERKEGRAERRILSRFIASKPGDIWDMIISGIPWTMSRRKGKLLNEPEILSDVGVCNYEWVIEFWSSGVQRIR